MKSLHVLVIISLIWFLAGTVYFPKWNKAYTEAAISWDVSGYYHYLPAVFIYNDIVRQDWMNGINEKYLPSTAYDQAFPHKPSGNKVNKYTSGQAILYAPFFLIAHAYALLSPVAEDGYSKPYQIAIWFGGFLISVLGLVLLRKILLNYFKENVTSSTLIAVAIGTHWFEYAAINNGMSHTWLFTLLCALILSTKKFYEKSNWYASIGIGVILGLATLVRPTEIIWILLPLLWGSFTIKERISFFRNNIYKILIAGLFFLAIISIQLIYWKYVSNEWIVDSYSGQGFNWFNPKIWRGLMGVNLGWWLYTPTMLVAMFGWYHFYKMNTPVFKPAIFISIAAVYITLSWAHWEEGGGLGQRNLIQIYPIMAFPLAAFISNLLNTSKGKLLWIIILCANIYYSLWWIHQAHKGGFFHAGQMNTKYFYHVAGRINPDENLLKLLDTKDYYSGKVNNKQIIFSEDFENDSLQCLFTKSDQTKAACLNNEVQILGPYIIPVDAKCNTWLRLEADFTMITREWDRWKQAQWIVQFFNGDEEIKTASILPHRLLKAEFDPRHIYFDVKIPGTGFDRCQVIFSNASSVHTLAIDNLQAACFRD